MKGPILAEILETLNTLFPFDQMEDWDNSGLQIGDPQAIVKGIAIALDPTTETIGFCQKNSCNVLITHHPLFMQGVRSLTPEISAGATALLAAKSEINIISLHTNADSCPGGLNDHICQLIGFNEIQIPCNTSLGRIIIAPEQISLRSLAERVGNSLSIKRLSIIGASETKVSKAFVVSGSGMSLLEEAKKEKAQVIITGDVKYHSALEAIHMGISIIDPGHFGMEKHFIDLVATKLNLEFEEIGINIAYMKCDCETDPFATAIEL